ncbi:hypothetical protein HDV02_000666 [Globomyces sp. JEL0801]|nr:hypothetical protein HDV02_000666 [Globomyces sp. JEL0801]
MSAIPAHTIGTLCVIGGVIGYAKSSSIASLVAGVAFGSLYGYSTYLMSANNTMGIKVAAMTSGVLLSVMGPKALKTAKPVSVLLTILSLIGSGYYGKAWWNMN